MERIFYKWGWIIVMIFTLMPVGYGQSQASEKGAKGKKLYLPAKIGQVPEDNDFDDDSSEFSFKRMIENDNFAIFWSREYGADPLANPVLEKRFDVHKILSECQRFYDYYVDVLKMVRKGESILDKYKILIIVFGGTDNTAYGGGEENKVGVFWTPATRISKEPYGVVAHELGHTFQFLSRIDCGTGARGAIMEMAAQYMLWQVYPEWMTFENYHLKDFMNQTHYAFLHPVNMYHSPYVLEYWSEKRGKEFYGELLRSTRAGEDPVMTYIRMNSLSQQQFNDEIFDACRRFMTWDMDRIREIASPYANQHHSLMVAEEGGWYRIAGSNVPQDYGYNGIRLTVPAKKKVKVQFEGILAGDESDNRAGWRYGLVAYLKDGRRVYSVVKSDAADRLTFKVPKNTAYLWLVVSGAPATHQPIEFGRRRGDNSQKPQPEWPYRVKLTGTDLYETEFLK